MDTLAHSDEKSKHEVPFSEGSSDAKGMPKLMKEKTAERKDEKNKGSRPSNRNLIICRHGSTKLNSDTIEKIRGWMDVPLDEKGVKEAEAMGKKLKGLVDIIISSDLKRAKETAKRVSEATGAPVVAYTKSLRPLNVGVFTGQPTDLVLGNIYDFIKRKPSEKIPDGESFDEFRKRFLSDVEAIEKKFPDKRVALVCHHRNERLYAAWRKKGAPSNFDFDWDTFAQKGTPPGTFLII